MILINLENRESEVKSLTKNIYNLFHKWSKGDKLFYRVHIIERESLDSKYSNAIAFEYGKNIRVNIYITKEGKIKIEAPDKVSDKLKDIIIEHYPEYDKLVA